MPVSDRSPRPPCQSDDGDGVARPGCCGTTSRALPPGRFYPVLAGHTQVGREACLEYAGVSSEKGLWRGVIQRSGRFRRASNRWSKSLSVSKREKCWLEQVLEEEGLVATRHKRAGEAVEPCSLRVCEWHKCSASKNIAKIVQGGGDRDIAARRGY